jgi:hypothetical protein
MCCAILEPTLKCCLLGLRSEIVQSRRTRRSRQRELSPAAICVPRNWPRPCGGPGTSSESYFIQVRALSACMVRLVRSGKHHGECLSIWAYICWPKLRPYSRPARTGKDPPPIPYCLTAFPMSTRNQIPNALTGLTSNFTPIFQTACDEYKRLTGYDLATHPFSAELDHCNSPDGILHVLGKQSQAFTRSRKRNEKLLAWLSPIVYVLSTFSGTLGEGIGLVSISPLLRHERSPTFVCFLAILTREDNIHGNRCYSHGMTVT